MKKDISQFLPLSPATLHILIALANEDRHGYGIMQEVARQTNDQYKLGPGTLYDNLQKLLDQGLIDEANRQDTDDPRRRYYRLTSLGEQVVSVEIQRLEGIFRKVKTHLNGVKPRRPNENDAKPLRSPGTFTIRAIRSGAEPDCGRNLGRHYCNTWR